MIPSNVFNTYWEFAVKRQQAFFRRLGRQGVVNDDPILRAYRFTNAYRAADRVSQYLIREVQYRPDRSRSVEELFFRTLLFKIFNRIETWELIEDRLGPLSWAKFDANALNRHLDGALHQGQRIYSAAYIMPAPGFGHVRKHSNHIALLEKMMRDGLPGNVACASSLSAVYQLLLQYSGIGRFLAFQYAIDLNYSPMLNFDEAGFVVAGPGAMDGIAKCFKCVGSLTPEDVISWTAERQEREFAARGLRFETLFGRRLQPVDCQNLFCEIAKYTRISHPNVQGASGRTKIKQVYKPSPRPMRELMFPPRWGLGAATSGFQGAQSSCAAQEGGKSH